MTRDNSYLVGNNFAKGNKPNKTCFKKGDTPWNSGVKGIHLSVSTEFKKGQRSINHKNVGTKTVRIDKSNKKRAFIKISEPSMWIECARFVWIQHNGEIPKGFLIHHIDGDTLNDVVDNLALVTRKAHFEIHKICLLGREKRSEIAATRMSQEVLAL